MINCSSSPLLPADDRLQREPREVPEPPLPPEPPDRTLPLSSSSLAPPLRPFPFVFLLNIEPRDLKLPAMDCALPPAPPSPFRLFGPILIVRGLCQTTASQSSPMSVSSALGVLTSSNSLISRGNRISSYHRCQKPEGVPALEIQSSSASGGLSRPCGALCGRLAIGVGATPLQSAKNANPGAAHRD